MSMNSDVAAIANDEFDAWANHRHLSLFDRAPYRTCWMAAYRAGYELAVSPATNDVDDDDSIDAIGRAVIDV
jgi:hypothetical protein